MNQLKVIILLSGVLLIGVMADLSASASKGNAPYSAEVLIPGTDGGPRRYTIKGEMVPDSSSSSTLQSSEDAASEAGAALWKACDGNAACMDKALQPPSNYEELN